LAVVGDFEEAEVKEWIEKYFGPLASSELPPKPDISEPKQEKEQIEHKSDTLAPKPAIAIAYKMPERNTPEYYAMGLIDQMLVQGQDSKLVQKLTLEKGYTGNVNGGINYLGNMYNYNGPMVWMSDLTYDATVSPDSILKVVDTAVGELNSVTQADVDMAIIKLRSDLYSFLGGNGFGRADLLASFALFDDDPSRINTLESQFKKVTPELIKKTVSEYLVPNNRTILIVDPKTTTKAL